MAENKVDSSNSHHVDSLKTNFDGNGESNRQLMPASLLELARVGNIPLDLVVEMNKEQIQSFPTLEDFKTNFKKFALLADLTTVLRDYVDDTISHNRDLSPLARLDNWNLQLEQRQNDEINAKAKAEELAAFLNKTEPEQSSTSDLFAVLFEVIDKLIDMSDTYLQLAMSYSASLENETKKQAVYLDILETLKPMSAYDLGLEKPDSEEAVDTMNTINQVIIPGAQSQVNSYNEISQNQASSLNSMITSLTKDATNISDLLSEINNKMTSWASSIYR